MEKNQHIPASFEAACLITGDNANIQFPEGVSKATVATHKLEIIHQATVGDQKPDFSKSTLKWTAWLWYNPSLGRFVYSDTGCTFTYSHLGARFWFNDEKTATEFFEIHADLVNDMMKGSIA